MRKAIEFFEDQIRGLRMGTVEPALLDTIKVSCYGGQQIPIKTVASTHRVGNGISVEPYDPQIKEEICSALKNAGFNAYHFSKTAIMVSVPAPDGEERAKIHKRIERLAEEAKVVVRQVRKRCKKADKDDIDNIQRCTDEAIATISKLAEDKIEELTL